MSDVVTTGLFTLGGVLLGGIVAPVGAAYSNRRSDKQKLRDDRLARLRTAFSPLLRNATTLPYVVHRVKYILENETQEQRDARLMDLLKESRRGIDDAEVSLMLEPDLDVADVLAQLQETGKAYSSYQVVLGARMAGGERLKALTEAEQRVTDTVDTLRAAMLSVIADAERPISLLPRPNKAWKWRKRTKQASKGRAST